MSRQPDRSGGWPLALRLLGLGARARTVISGVDIIRGAAKRDELSLAIVASDAAENTVSKVVPLLAARGVTYVVGPDAVTLGGAVGRAAVAAVGVLDSRLAEGVLGAVERIGPDADEGGVRV